MKLLVCLFVSVVCLAQTTVKVSQIQSPTSNALRLLSFAADGKPAYLTLGPGLGVSNGQIVLMATAIPSVVVVPVRLVQASDGTYIVTPGAALYSRNGLIQEIGKDFTIEVGKLIPLLTWASDDVVVQHGIRVNGTPQFIP